MSASATKKRKRSKENDEDEPKPKCSSSSSSTVLPLHQKIGKMFPDKSSGKFHIHYGTLTSSKCNASNRTVYRIAYDDATLPPEDLYTDQALDGIRLFSQFSTASTLAKAALLKRRSWRPPKHIGTRKPGYFGCGKCRWGPKGCLGCRASNCVSPPPTPMPEGQVHGSLEPSASFSNAFEIVADDRQSDANGFGIIAKRFISKRERFVDTTASYSSRPAAYAQAHLGSEDYIACGVQGYFLLVEHALRQRSFTFFLNMSGFTADQRLAGHQPNIKWEKREAKFGGAGLPELTWKVLKDIQQGEEILVNYNEV